MRITTHARAAAAGLAIALGLGTAVAEQPPAPSEQPAKAKEVAIGDVRIAVDPKTGELRPVTPAEARKLENEMRKRFPARVLELKRGPDGTLSSVVAPNVLSFSVVRVGPDGKLTTSCASGVDESLERLKAATPAASGPEEK